MDAEESDPKKTKHLRCMDWLKKQNSETKKQSLQNKNDIQFIIQTNTDRKNFLLSVAEDEATVPSGINEPAAEPKVVPLHRLRVDHLRMECEWQSCKLYYSDYEGFQKHVRTHFEDVKQVMENDGSVQYACLWDVCGHKTPDFKEMIRHINYHAYHAKLLAIGFNGRATLKLARCRKDSSKRNQLPNLPIDHHCMWTGCGEKYNAVQVFLSHVKLHVQYSENRLCSWAGCGATFTRREVLEAHVRSHTGEKLIACYHCGGHFIGNRKLCDHSRRQNVYPNSPYSCSMCGIKCATEYLLNEHSRQHVSAYVCALCDMSAPTPAALAHHVRYRHMVAEDARLHACHLCPYKAVTKCDLRKHIVRHEKRIKKEERAKNDDHSDDNSDDDCKKNTPVRKYACHLCPEKQMKIFLRGTRLTTHLVKVHGAQWPYGHSRFRYQRSEDGMYRLTTTRYEILEVSKKIVDRDSGPKESLTKNKFDFKLRQVAEPTENTPRRFEITLDNGRDDGTDVKPELVENAVEITMCDIDEDGNVIKSEVFNSVVK